MAYAHSRGVLHRDLKPANIQLGSYGETLVVDWGLAKTMESPGQTSEGNAPPLWPALRAKEDTHEGVVVGTPAFMSPEQASGRGLQVGPASDIYSLGAILYTILTGRTPVEKGTVQDVLRGVQRGEFAAPRALRPDIPRALEAICLRAMALRPESRYASARSMADDIERWLADEPTSAYQEPLSTRLRRSLRRHRPIAVGAAVAVLLTFLGLLSLQTKFTKQQELQHHLKAANETLISTNQQLIAELARSTDDLGSRDQEAGRLEEAAANYRRAHALWKILVRQHPEVGEYRSRRAATSRHLTDLSGRIAGGDGDRARARQD
jgi:serine/threonine protein kinase